MLKSFATFSMLISSSVRGFAPSQPFQKPASMFGKTHQSVIDPLKIQLSSSSRKNDVSLHAMLSTGLDPMFTTVLLGAFLLGTMVAYEQGEYTAVSNSSKSLVANKTELEEPVETAIAEADKAVDIDIQDLKKESTDVDVAEKAEEETVMEPAKEDVEKTIDVEAERIKLVRILGNSPPMKSVELPESPEIIESEEPTPLAVKAVVKAMMPWKNFDNISGPTPTVAKLVVKTLMPWKKISSI